MISIEVKGLAELKQRFAKLPQAMQTKIAKGMVSTGAAIFREEAVRLAPEYTGTVQQGHPPPGTLKRAIYQTRVRAESVGTREVWRVGVFKGKQPGKKDASLDAYYATWVEYGTVNMAARPFMRPAFELQKEHAADAMGTYLAFALPRVVEELG